MTTPIKQNSPDEAAARLLALNCFHEMKANRRNLSLLWDTYMHSGNPEAILQIHFLAALRKSKAGQVEEERKPQTFQDGFREGWLRACVFYVDIDACDPSHDCSLQLEKRIADLGKPEAVEDHAQAVLQKAFNWLLGAEHRRLCTYWQPLSTGRLPCNCELLDVRDGIQELLSTQGVSSTAAGVSLENKAEIGYPAVCTTCWRVQMDATECPHCHRRTLQPVICESPFSSPQVEQVSAVQESLRDETLTPSTQDHVATQKKPPYDFAPWKPPFRYDVDGSRIVDSEGRWILDVRGWGFLTGKGHEALGMREEIAEGIQDALGEHVTKLLNLTSIGCGNENQGADQVFENPCAVQGEWKTFRDSNGDTGIEMPCDFPCSNPADNPRRVYLADQHAIDTLVAAHNALHRFRRLLSSPGVSEHAAGVSSEICGAYAEHGFNEGKGCPQQKGHTGNHAYWLTREWSGGKTRFGRKR